MKNKVKIKKFNSQTIRKDYIKNVKDFFTVFGITIAPAIIFSLAIVVFGAYIHNELNELFTPKFAGSAVGFFFMYMGLFFINLIVGYNCSSKYLKDKVINALTGWFLITVTFFVSAYFVSRNKFVLPIIFIALVTCTLMNKKLAFVHSTTMTAVFLIAFTLHTSHVTNKTEAILAILASAGTTFITLKYISTETNRAVFLVHSFLYSCVGILFSIFASAASGIVNGDIGFNVLWTIVTNVGSILLITPIALLLEWILNLTNDFRLRELCSLNNALLVRLANEAPGTFTHSLAVGTIAEYCAIAIGESGALAKCAAYYHDIGKLKSPQFFTENQTGKNPHDDLIPEVSANIITAHTVFGQMLAKKNRLPKEVADICVEHHGTTPVGYFYNIANDITEDKSVSREKYRYHGTIPQSKISVIIMIADTIEATFRSYNPKSAEDIKEKIDSLVEDKIKLGQFDEAPITFAELTKIKQTIFDIIPSMFHKRISYVLKDKQ